MRDLSVIKLNIVHENNIDTENIILNESSSDSNTSNNKIDDVSHKNAKSVSENTIRCDSGSIENQMVQLIIHDTLLIPLLILMMLRTFLFHLMVVHLKILKTETLKS